MFSLVDANLIPEIRLGKIFVNFIPLARVPGLLLDPIKEQTWVPGQNSRLPHPQKQVTHKLSIYLSSFRVLWLHAALNNVFGITQVIYLKYNLGRNAQSYRGKGIPTVSSPTTCGRSFILVFKLMNSSLPMSLFMSDTTYYRVKTKQKWIVVK